MPKRPLEYLFFVALFWLCGAASGQSYPSRPIRLIVPFAPGGAVEGLARLMAPKMGEQLGQQIVVDTRPGAAGMIGTQLAAKAIPDGHTLLLTSLSPLVISVNLLEGKRPYDPEKDLSPVSLITHLPLVITVHSSNSIRNVQQLISAAKASPRKLTYGSSGTGSINHLTGEFFKSAAAVDLLHIPYKGAGPSVIALMSNEVDMIFSSPPAIVSLVRAGQLRALAVSGAQRSPALPEVPTVSEAGIPEFNATAWYCVMAPAGTPRPFITQVGTAMLRAMQTPQVSNRLREEGGVPQPSTPEELGKLIHTDLEKWTKAIKMSDAKLN